MSFGNLGFMDILIILLLVLLLFGAKRIPEIAASMGKGIREFKRSVTDIDRSINEPSRDEPRERLRAADQPAPAAKQDDSEAEPKRLLS
ncbi:MAG: Sec-independent protein translocase subunit TatA/TatB [Gemmatimonadaceae bacterium]